MTCLTLASVCLSASVLSAEKIVVSDDPLADLAKNAYRAGQQETGHIHLKALIDNL